MRKLAFLTGLILSSVCLLAAADDQVREAERNATFTVALNGSDSNPGTLEKPFATIERARDEVRKLVAAGLKEDVTVFIRGGTYALARTVLFGLADSGNPDHSITYAAYPGETPVFSGGVRITGWRRLEASAALPPAARGKVWVTDLPDTRGGKWRFHALFDGGQMLPRARSDGFKPLLEESTLDFGRAKTKDFWSMPFATAA